MRVAQALGGLVMGAFLGLSVAVAGGLWWPGMLVAGALVGAVFLPWAARHPELR